MVNIKCFIDEKGYLFFQIGVFFILSAPNIAALFILLSLISSHISENKFLIKNNWLYPFFLSGFIAILSALNSSFRYSEIDGWSPYLSWIGLANWLPFFYFMWRSQIYLYRNEMRQRISNLFLAGSVTKSSKKPLLGTVGKSPYINKGARNTLVFLPLPLAICL